MSYESVNKIKSLQQGIEAVTGNNYSDLTAAVQDLKNGYGGEEDYNEGYEAGKLDGYSEGYTASQNARQEKSITQNGEYTPDEGYSGFSKVTVNVSQKEEQEKTVNITQNGTKEVTADSGKTLSKVTITTNVAGGGGREPIVEPLSVTENGTYIPSEGVDGFDIVTVNVPTEGGGGSGIIDVTELPTSNIDENAIYKVVVDEESTIYVIRNGAIIDEKNFIQSIGLNELYKYFVDELPADMLETDPSGGIAYGYVINSTGVGYLKIKGPGAILTFGAVAFSDAGYDKGYTTDITLETQNGVYVQKGKHSEDWFYRESGEWVRITPEQENKQITLATPLRTTITPEEGKVFSSVTVDVGFKSIGDFIDRNVTLDKITENDLTKTDGTALTYIREYAFAGSKVKSIVLPSTIRYFGTNAFLNATVEEVTFKGRPNSLGQDLFTTCANLRTINVPWSYAQVSNAPWGATNATINYNYTGG